MLVVNFLRGLFDENGTVSSKRLSGLMCVTCCCFIFVMHAFRLLVVDHHMFDALLLFAAICFGMNAFIQAKGMDVKETVATNMVDKDKPLANQDAKDVLKADKP